MKKLHIIIFALIFFISAGGEAAAQKWAAAANLGDAVDFGAFGISCSFAAGRHITVNAGARANPWIFNKGTSRQFQSRHQTYYAGVRYWYSQAYYGWWTGTGLQFQEYNRGGILAPETEEGNAYGLVLNGGYSIALCGHLNLDLGLSMWCGVTDFIGYSCPKCGRITSSGTKFFLLPDDLIVSLVWIF